MKTSNKTRKMKLKLTVSALSAVGAAAAFSLSGSFSCAPQNRGIAQDGLSDGLAKNIACPVPSNLTEEWKRWATEQVHFYPQWEPSRIQAELEACSDLPSNPEAMALVDRIRRLTRVELKRKDASHSMGFAVTNEEYLAAQPNDLMELPAELQNGMPADWEQVFAAKGWAFTRYRSGFIENPPNQSRNRVLVQIASETHDQWIQITMPPSAGEGAPKAGPERMIDMIVVQKLDGSTKLPRPRIHFRQYVRDETGGAAHVRRGPELGAVENCYSCHAQGMREIIPAPGSLAAADLAKVQSFNQTFRTYGMVDWNGTIVPEDHGPALGQRVGCAHCHDGVNRGAVTTATDATSIERKVLQELSMPPTRLTTVVAALRARQERGEAGLTDEQKQLLTRQQTRNESYHQLFNRLMASEVRAWLLPGIAEAERNPSQAKPKGGKPFPAPAKTKKAKK